MKDFNMEHKHTCTEPPCLECIEYAKTIDMGSTQDVLEEIRIERQNQDHKWGQQNHPNGTGSDFDKMMAQTARSACDTAFANGEGNWRLILNEEFCEALAENDPIKLRTELLQTAAVCVAWVEAIDRQITKPGST